MEYILTVPTLKCYLDQYDMGTSNVISVSQEATWLYTTAQVLYYAYPIVVAIGVALTLVTAITTCKMAIESHECYLATYNVCALALLLTIAGVQLPNYVVGVGMSDTYQRMLPYLICLQNWFWYATTWTLATAALERGMSNLSDRTHYGCGKLHGILVSVLVVFVNLVNTLPQFWEYQGETTLLEGLETNCSVLAVRTTPELEGSHEYYIYHWYATVVSSLLPYAVLPMLLPALICSPGYYYTSVTSVSSRSPALKYHENSSMKEQVADEKEFNRLIMALLSLYLFFGAPYIALRVSNEEHLRVSVLEEEPQLKATLTGLFEMLYWLFFSVAFFLHLIVCRTFRNTMLFFCRCKKDEDRYYY